MLDDDSVNGGASDIDGVPAENDPAVGGHTSLLHHIVIAKMAYIAFYFFKRDRDMTSEHIKKAMDALDNFEQRLPVHLNPNNPVEDTYQYATPYLRGIGWQRFAFSVGPNFIRLYVARTAFGRLVSGDKSELVRYVWNKGIEAARNVIQRVADPSIPLLFLKFWCVLVLDLSLMITMAVVAKSMLRPITGSVISAGTYLVLNLICFGAQGLEDVGTRSDLVQQSIDYLHRIESFSDQARKSAQILAYLLQVSRRHPSATPISNLSDLMAHLRDARQFIYNQYEQQDREFDAAAASVGCGFETTFGGTDLGEASSQVLNQFWPADGGFSGGYEMPYSEYDMGEMAGMLDVDGIIDGMTVGDPNATHLS